MQTKILSVSCLSAIALLAVAAAVESTEPVYEVVETIPVARVWAGHRVGFDLLTTGDTQYVAFYDSERRMTVGSRKLPATEWTLQQLPSRVEWDSHNYITMAIDRAGMLHVSGNMHGVPLIYFRSTRPGDVTSLEQVPAMTGKNEDKCTYPEFFNGVQGELIFAYRDGGSGSGNQIYNVYDESSRAWKRLFDVPFSDGAGLMNAYFLGPVKGPDGFHHLTWIWRDTPDCSTNHDLCYARSRDFVHWETAAGDPIHLPIRHDTPGVIVDPVPVKGGMLNGNGKIGFDSKNRVVLAYHKFDANGHNQLYNARFENGAWRIYQATQWDYRWEFSGGGTIIGEIHINEVKLRNGRLEQQYSHKTPGSGILILDEETLKPIDTAAPPRWPAEVSKIRSAFPEMRLNLREGRGDPGYIMRWETLPQFRDQPRPEPWPEPSLLEILKYNQP